MVTKDKLCSTCVDTIRTVINDLMLADYPDYILPPPVAKAVNDLLSLLPPIKEDDDEGN